MSLSTIPEALTALKAGRPVIVADDENRENEGDIIISAELASPEWIAWMVRWTSGLIWCPSFSIHQQPMSRRQCRPLKVNPLSFSFMPRPPYASTIRLVRPFALRPARL